MGVFLLFVCMKLFLFQWTNGIVNLYQQTADPIFRSRVERNRGPDASHSGIDCLNKISQIFFLKREGLTRSPNVFITRGEDMQEPTGEIQDGFLKTLNEAVVEETTAELYQLRIFSENFAKRNRSKNSKKSKYFNYIFLADYYVIVIDTIERLKELLRVSAELASSWNPGARFLVLYNNVEERECKKNRWKYLYKIRDEVDEFQNETDIQFVDPCQNYTKNENEVMMTIYEEMQKNYYIHRIALLYAHDALNYSISVMDYFSKDACRTRILRKIGFCNNGAISPGLKYVKYLMDEIQNHRNSANCTLYLCASINAPFVEADCRQGLEIRLLDFMGSRLKLDFKKTCTRDSRGIQSGTKNWTGLLGKLMFGDCDFIIGGYYPDNDVSRAFGTSSCYLDDSYTWYIKLADERPAWMALYTIFDATTWICFLAMTPITWIFWYLLVKMLPEPQADKEFSLIGINNIGVCICVAVNERPLCHATRIFWLTLAIYGLNIASLYTSRLIAVFSNPGYLHQIENLNEVIEAGIPFGGREESADWFENDDDMWIFDRYNDSEDFIPNSENLEEVTMGNRVILSSRMYITQHNASDKVFGFPESVFRSPVQIIMKPGFPFLYELNTLISRMSDAGLFDYLLDRFDFNNTYLKRIAKLRPHFTENAIVLTTEHVQGTFTLLIFGTILSGVILLIEICTHKYSMRKKSTIHRGDEDKSKLENKKDKKNKTKKQKREKLNSIQKQIEKPKGMTTNRIRRKTNTKIRNLYGKNKDVNIIRLTPILNRDIVDYNNYNNYKNKSSKNQTLILKFQFSNGHKDYLP